MTRFADCALPACAVARALHLGRHHATYPTDLRPLERASGGGGGVLPRAADLDVRRGNYGVLSPLHDALCGTLVRGTGIAKGAST